MDNQKVKPLWDDDDYKPLRKPAPSSKSDTESVSTNSCVSKSLDILKSSNLSALAKEFIPAFNYTQNASSLGPGKPSVQDRLHKYKHTETDQNLATYSNREHQYVYEAIELLTRKPGKFDSIIIQLLDHLEPYYGDVDTISKITKVIFDQALTQANFPYTGARLCAAIDQRCALLRANLHQFSLKELETTSNLSSLTMFLAEIYTQMNYELFGQCLNKAIKKLLDKPTPDNVKTACLTLKLSGAKLDKSENDSIDVIFQQLQSISPNMPSSIRNLVESVISLRAKQWGLVESSSSNMPPPAEPADWADGPVFYGPDGQQLTLEESDFLLENIDDLILDDSDPDTLWNPEPEMNEEIQEAFAEFLKMSNR